MSHPIDPALATAIVIALVAVASLLALVTVVLQLVALRRASRMTAAIRPRLDFIERDLGRVETSVRGQIGDFRVEVGRHADAQRDDARASM